MTTFLFVRHAVTAHTGARLTGWMPDVHLSERGREQARAVGDRLAGVPLKGVYSSPIERTVETARAIAVRHQLKVETRQGLGEVQYGGWTNRPLKALARTKLWQKVQRFPSAARFPGGETLRETQARALTEVEAIAEEHRRGVVCCVSHADVIKLIVAHYLGVHIDLFQRIAISPASMTAIALYDSGPMVLCINAVDLSEGALWR